MSKRIAQKEYMQKICEEFFAERSRVMYLSVRDFTKKYNEKYNCDLQERTLIKHLRNAENIARYLQTQ